MAATGFTPVSLYYSATASNVPLAANLVAGELAMNTNDGKLFYKDSSGVVQTMASKGTGSIGGSTTQVQFNNAGVLGGSASLTWSGTVLTSSGFAGPLNGTVGATTANTGSFTTLTTSSTITDNGGTANGVTYLNGSKVVTSGSALTFDGSTLGVGAKLQITAPSITRYSDFNTTSSGYGFSSFSYNGTAYGYVSQASATFGGGSNTDFALSAVNNLVFGASNSEQMRLTSTGLGIGTSSPSAKLTVSSTGSSIELKQNATGAATYYVMDNTVETGGKRWRFGYSGAAGIPCFSLYNQTDSILSLVADASGNLGLGVTPSAWGSNFKAQQLGNYGAFIAAQTNQPQVHIGANAFYNGTNWTYINNSQATRYYQASGSHVWETAGAGTGTITFTQAMTLDASGNLGVGSTNPSVTGYGKAVRLQGTGNAAYEVTDGTVTTVMVSTAGSLGVVRTDSNHPLVFGTNGTERMRIDTSGRLIVGASSATGSNQVEIQTGLTNGLWVQTGSISSSNYIADFRNGSNTPVLQLTADNTTLVNGNLLVGTTSGTSYKLNLKTSAASQSAIGTAGTSGDTAFQSILISKFDNDSTTSQNFIQFQINNGGANCGKITANGANTAAFGSTSDQRVKENIVELPSQLANIMALRPVEFDYLESYGGGHQIGFIAQEVKEVYPDVISEDDSPQKIMSITGWSKTEARLVKAIQEQQVLITQLTTRLVALEAK